jgi:hypothetical protein
VRTSTLVGSHTGIILSALGATVADVTDPEERTT